VQEYSAQGMRTLGPSAALLAEAEGLIGHAQAIRVRLAPAVRQKRLAPRKLQGKARRIRD
jgi:histidinol dehydrogenase